jgi:hypothetical protein
MVLSKHVAHYDPRPGSQHYNLKPPNREDSTNAPHGDALDSSVCFIPGNLGTFTGNQE